MRVGELPESCDDVCDARDCDRLDCSSVVDEVLEFVVLMEASCASRVAILCCCSKSLE